MKIVTYSFKTTQLAERVTACFVGIAACLSCVATLCMQQLLGK